MRQLRRIDWEAIACIAAALIALLLDLLQVSDQSIVVAVVLVILTLLLLRDLRRDTQHEEDAAGIIEIREALGRLEDAVTAPDVILVGPQHLRSESARFARDARGEMLWFNVCLSMFEPQELFDVLLRPAFENPAVTGIQFVLSHSEQPRWESAIRSKASVCSGYAKLREPRWRDLDQNISFILAQNPANKVEAHVSFWSEPFMSRQRGRDIPRYVVRVLDHSPLINGLIELERDHRGNAIRSRLCQGEG